MNQDLDSKRRWTGLLLTLFLGIAAFALFPGKASAIPAWARRYDVSCSTCHAPTPPRLNAYGHRFRRAQYRLPEEFNQDPEWSKVQNYLAARAVGGYTYSSAENPGSDFNTVTSTFTLDEVSLMYAGPVTKHFSGFVELERPGDEATVEAVVSIGGVFGKPENFYTFRFGQFHPLVEAGWGGLDRPTGITGPDVLSQALTTASGFTIDQDQVGVEGTFVHKNWRIIGQVLNGANASSIDGADAGDNAFTTTDHADQNKDKDFVLAYELMWGDTASGLTAFAYRGILRDPVPGPGNVGQIDMSRYGVTAAQVWQNGWEIQGGFAKAKDDYELSGLPHVSGQGWWVEGEKYFKSLRELTLLARYDMTDPDTDLDDNSRTRWTLGAVWPVADYHTRLALEIRSITQQDGTGSPDLKTHECAFELMLNF